MVNNNKISIIMTTYNGTKYIYGQLDSIRKQSIQPDEVLIFDDVSIDDTVEVIDHYISEYKLNNWILYRNTENKGWQRNFIDGIQKAKGDVVFLSDQDDIWHPKKIEIMSTILHTEKQAEIVICDHKPFYSEEYNEKFGIVTGKYIKMKALPGNNVTTFPGCTYCFRRSFFETIKDAWIEGYPHDALIYNAAWYIDEIYFCKDKLHFFRRHAESVTTLYSTDYDPSHRVERLIRKYNSISKLDQIERIEHEKNTYVDGMKFWLKLRISVLNSFKLIDAIRLIAYIKYYPSVKTFFTDIFVAKKFKR